MPNNDYILRSDAIDAMTLNKLKRNLDSVYDEEGKRYCRAAQRVIASLPAADVEPVKHGKWIPINRINPAWGQFGIAQHKCSACGSEEVIARKRCPECGAKMGVEEDGIL